VSVPTRDECWSQMVQDSDFLYTPTCVCGTHRLIRGRMYRTVEQEDLADFDERLAKAPANLPPASRRAHRDIDDPDGYERGLSPEEEREALRNLPPAKPGT